MRNDTERWYAWKDDCMIGTNPDDIFEKTKNKYMHGKFQASSLYGIGLASGKILDTLSDYYTLYI